MRRCVSYTSALIFALTATVTLAQKVTTPEDLDKAMKRIAPAQGAATKAILTNKEVIAVDQDPLGKQGRVVAGSGTNQEVWSKEMSGTNVRAVALFNRGGSSAAITVKWSQIGLPAGSATVRDLWKGTDLGAFTDQYTVDAVASHDVVMLKIVSASP